MPEARSRVIGRTLGAVTEASQAWDQRPSAGRTVVCSHFGAAACFLSCPELADKRVFNGSTTFAGRAVVWVSYLAGAWTGVVLRWSGPVWRASDRTSAMSGRYDPVFCDHRLVIDSLDASLIRVTIDWTTLVVTLLRDDGAVGTAQLLREDSGWVSRVRSTTWSPPLDAVAFETTDGDHVAFELPRFDGADQLEGRLIVYLDQNIWSRVARAINNPALAPAEPEAQAAAELAELVRQRKVLLPLSSGHYSETTACSDNVRRYQLGLTILRLSRGWQMRDPLVMRRQELRRALLRSIFAEPLQRPWSMPACMPDSASSMSTRP